MSGDKFKIIVYVPVDHAENVREAAFAVGAGTIGQYTRVAFTSSGTSCFTPNAQANPAIGKPGVEEVVQEVKIEITAVGREVVRQAVERIRKVHPYEEVVVDVYRLEDF
ncbi:hypothetical protein NliqN6_5960 [Naganishia liquefaciens]|uniref:ATP phosphoribosyltransferase n=1 Tax=Naganishia liquefaciens TaxID=104408 RepID=A0A8H3YHP2_9TREE|nr:hypothetical protein NliqN6_5960 [Naganishia liquefaciens]